MALTDLPIAEESFAAMNFGVSVVQPTLAAVRGSNPVDRRSELSEVRSLRLAFSLAALLPAEPT